MINVGMYYKVIQGHEAEFEHAFNKVVETLKSSAEGLEDAKLYREVGRSEYLIYTEWNDMKSFRNFMQSRGFGETKEYGKSIIEGRPTHRVFREADDVP